MKIMSDESDAESIIENHTNVRVYPRPWNDLHIQVPKCQTLELFKEEDVATKLQTEYWRVGNPKVSTGSDPNSNFKSQWFRFSSESRQRESRIELTEYQVVRECLWVLLGAEKSFLFVTYTDGEILTKNVCLYTRKPACLTHLTYGALDSFCAEIAESATNMLQLRAFVNFVLLSENEIPLPFIRLAQFCEKLRADAVEAVSNLEREAKGDDPIVLTLISLSNKWQIWFHRLSFMSTLLLQVMSPQMIAIFTPETSIILLNRLEELTRSIHRSYPDSYLIDLIGKVFISTTEAYLRTVLSASTLNNIPFIKYNDVVSPSDPEFWNSGVSLISSSVPNILVPIISDVLIGAKSLSILKAISSTFKCPKLVNGVEFEYRSNSDLNKEEISKEDADSGVGESEYHDDPDIQEMVQYMESTFFHRSKYVLFEEIRESSIESSSKTIKYLREWIRSQSLKISSRLVSSLLHGPLAENGAWLTAVDCFANDLSLLHGFDNLSKIAFFRSGEWMYAFCEEVFGLQRIENRTDSFLSRALKEQAVKVCGEISWLPERIRFRAREDNLEIWIPWPLNIVIGAGSLTIYSNVFKFLFTLKEAKWTLDNSKWTLESGDHKLALLRSRCLYVINGIHAFIADHIEVAHTEFMTSLTRPDVKSNLDNLLECYSTYLTRVKEICLLADSVSQKMLNQTLVELFKLCEEFRSPADIDLECFASEFSTRVSFLRTVLSEALQGSGCVRTEAYSLLKILEESRKFNTGVITRLHF